MSLRKSGDGAKIRRQTLQLTSMMARWCQVREDLMFIFEKVMESELGNPIREVIHEFVSRVRGGMTPDRALLLMQDSVPHEQFADLMTAVRFNFKHRGNLAALLEQMEIHFHRIEEEYEHRRLSNLRDQRLALMILGAVPIAFLIRLLGSPETRGAFFELLPGSLMLAICLSLYIGAITAYLLIRRRISG